MPLLDTNMRRVLSTSRRRRRPSGSVATRTHRLVKVEPLAKILKFEANLAKVLLGFVILEGRAISAAESGGR